MDGKDLAYWKTSKSSPDEWLRKASWHVEDAGGTIIERATAFQYGRTAVCLGFELDGDTFRLVWPVLEHEPCDNQAAVRQAATMLYHDVKARCVAVRVKGARWAFHGELVLSDGRMAGELTDPELMKQLPAMCQQPLAIEHAEAAGGDAQ
ncbi:hypothetical protein LCGC14_1399820 [marine sediment metagenome]|uniref:Uncharacterized protein n=1 Tax=marine sediment metagenome TaxID=412755 RepID=A0A0F9KIB2_9ZZZZ